MLIEKTEKQFDSTHGHLHIRSKRGMHFPQITPILRLLPWKYMRGYIILFIYYTSSTTKQV